jgi:AP-4 complex subunit mu-1
LQIRADIPEANYGTNVIIKFPVPKNAATVTPELGPGALAAPAKGVAAAVAAAAGAGTTGGGQTAEYNAKDREVVWQIKKFPGATEHVLRTKITLSSASTTNIRKEIGPVSMSFEIPMYNVSNLQVRYLRIAETSKSYKPYRWVRYVATSNSYVCRL